MKSLTHVLTIFTLLLVSLPCLADDKAKQKEANGKLKVFVLAGQSNMVGFGTVLGDKPGTMQTAVKNEPDKYGHLVKDGDPIVRKDVYVVNLSAPANRKRQASLIPTSVQVKDSRVQSMASAGWSASTLKTRCSSSSAHGVGDHSSTTSCRRALRITPSRRRMATWAFITPRLSDT